VQAHTTETHIDNFHKTRCDSGHHPWPTGILIVGRQSNCDGQPTTRQHISFTEKDEGNKQGATGYQQAHLSFLDDITTVSNLAWQILLTVIRHSTLRHGIYHLPPLMLIYRLYMCCYMSVNPFVRCALYSMFTYPSTT
jgi:hypothetical protein